MVLERVFNGRENLFGDVAGPIELLDDNYLPVTLITAFSKGRVHPNAIIKNLKKRGIIAQEAQRRFKGSKKYTCYEIIDKKWTPGD